MSENYTEQDYEIAIIGMAGRFPKANNISEYWSNIVNGKECTTFFSEQELLDVGVNPEDLQDSNYIKARPYIEGIEYFDADFFKIGTREATLMDPQHRIFMEQAWKALEDAGYVPSECEDKIGIFASCDTNTYLLRNMILSEPQIVHDDPLAIKMNDKDYLCTRASYHLGLTGPSVMIQSACSSAIGAVHYASESILFGECDMAIAGAVSLTLPNKSGYFYKEGGVVSKDGHVCAFDKNSSGTVYGDGLGVVILKCLSKAIEDNDHIYAVIKGMASNNDGAERIGFTAPGVDGQKEVIQDALDISGVEPETIQYIETHGTGTKLGDSIEIAALKDAFSDADLPENSCALGSVKPNIGHASTASGIASLIKVALSLDNKVMPPTIHYSESNPDVHLEDSPFYVNTTAKEWKKGEKPRRAGISAFGLGGSNTHIILEEAPERREKEERKQEKKVILLSAKKEEVLKQYEAELSEFLDKNKDTDLAELAYTMKHGRSQFLYRSAVVADSIEGIINSYKDKDYTYVTGKREEKQQYVLMFPGVGEEYEGVARKLYEGIPQFKEILDDCRNIVMKKFQLNIYDYLLEEPKSKERQKLAICYTYVMVFSFEYALAKTLEQMGLEADNYIGYSIGEYVAATLAGVFALPDVLELMYQRGSLIDGLGEGAMISVIYPADKINELLNEKLFLAAIEAPNICVVSGDCEEVEQLKNKLITDGIAVKQIPTNRAFHSYQMQPIVAAYKEIVDKVKKNTPTKPFISNVTGDYITEEEATSSDYWSGHLVHTVQYAKGIKTLLEGNVVLVEVGVGNSLSVFAMQQSAKLRGKTVQLIPTSFSKAEHVSYFTAGLAKLWCLGTDILWEKEEDEEPYPKISAPTYPFQKTKYWLQPKSNTIFGGFLANVSTTDESERVELQRDSIQDSYEEAKTETQIELEKIWENVLGISKIGINDNFFEIGGNSLLAVNILYAVKRAFQIEIKMETFMQNPRISYLDEYITTFKMYKEDKSESEENIENLGDWEEYEL